jgi:hypothetical protein
MTETQGKSLCPEDWSWDSKTKSATKKIPKLFILISVVKNSVTCDSVKNI